MIAVAGIAVLHRDARPLFDGLLSGPGLAALVGSALAGLGALGLVWRRRFGPARYAAALAVAAIVAGWALAQRPVLLPGLTVQQAAAPRATLVAVTVAVLGGAVVLFPCLVLLLRLVLRGRFDPTGHPCSDGPTPGRDPGTSRPGRWAWAALTCLLAGFGLLTVAEAGWAHAAGVGCLLAFIALGFVAIDPANLARPDRR